MSSLVSCMSAARRRISGWVGSSTCAAFCSRMGLPILAMRRTAMLGLLDAPAAAGEELVLDVGAVARRAAAPAPHRRAEVVLVHELAGDVERREGDVVQVEAQVGELVAELDDDDAFGADGDALDAAAGLLFLAA